MFSEVLEEGRARSGGAVVEAQGCELLLIGSIRAFCSFIHHLVRCDDVYQAAFLAS